jgi:hypothetical protein
VFDKVVEWGVKNLEKVGATTGEATRITEPRFSSGICEGENALVEYFSRIKEGLFTLMGELRPERGEVSKVATTEAGAKIDRVFDHVPEDVLNKLTRVRPEASRENLDAQSTVSPDLDEDHITAIAELRETRANLKNASRQIEEEARKRKQKETKKEKEVS